jgi:hypothetical protein
MIEVFQAALRHHGIDDDVTAVGEFYPRGHTGGGFAGGLIGSDLGDAFGSLAGGVGMAAGYSAGTRAADATAGLPGQMLVGTSPTTVYGFAATTRHDEPATLVFRVPRDQLNVQVHQRVNVRVLELIDTVTGSRIELEGNRLPVTHSRDVIDELSG